MTTGLSGALLTLAPIPSAEAAPGTVTGTVFRDYNANGAMDTGGTGAIDVGVADVTVAAFDDTGAEVGTATTGADGTYTLDYTADGGGTAVRLEFEVPEGYVSTHAGLDGTSGTSVQFVEAGETADLGIARPDDYVAPSGNPPIVGSVATEGPTGASVQTTRYNANGVLTPTTIATNANTGSVFAVENYSSNWVFSAAMLKRFVGVGPSGLGGIYLTNAASGAPNAVPFATIPDAGTDPRGGLPPAQDGANVFADIGKVGLGGIALDSTHTTLYAVNLNDKQVYEVAVERGPAGAPVAGSAPTALPAPPAAPECDPDQSRPYGLTFHDGRLYLGVLCSGPTSADLDAHVFAFTPGGEWETDPAFSTSLAPSAYDANLVRGCVNLAFDDPALSPKPTGCKTGNRGPKGEGGNVNSAAWNSWGDDPQQGASGVVVGNLTPTWYPQPMLTDLAVTSGGDLLVGLRDRFGDQGGWFNQDPEVGRPVATETAGQILKACEVDGAWQAEQNGSCGGVAGANTDASVGDAHQFFDQVFNSNAPGSGFVVIPHHPNTGNGGILQLPGFATHATSEYDAIDTTSATNPNNNAWGLSIYDNADGSLDHAQQWGRAADAAATGFGKSNGIGDLDALLDLVPIEIGNRVWLDPDDDGIQDPSEEPVEGVNVALQCATGEQGTTVTDADGEYYFNATNVDGGLSPESDCTLTFDTAGTTADGAELTTMDAGENNLIDSDAEETAGQVTVAATTPVSGADHSFDVGFVPPLSCAIGDYVWYDTNRDGIQDEGEEPVPGVTVTLLDSDGEPVEGVEPTTTDDEGWYGFDEVVCGDYQVSFTDLPAGYSLTEQAAGDDRAVDSDPNASNGITPTFTVGEEGPNTSPSTGEDPFEADLVDPTIDAGLVKETCSVGDTVWFDQNRNGIQDEGEEGVPGATVELLNADGEVVDTTETGEDGTYEFTDVECAEYTVRFTIPESVGSYTTPNTGNDDAVDSDPTPSEDNPRIAQTEPFTVGEDPENPEDNTNPTIDAGVVGPTCAVGDYVWIDTNRNGVQDEGEEPVPGVTVTLLDSEGEPVEGVEPTTTDDQGWYAFDLVECGEYQVSFTELPDGYVFTEQTVDGAEPAEDSNPDPRTGVTDTFAVGAEDPNTAPSTADDPFEADLVDPTIDAGLVEDVCFIGDTVWFDVNENGKQDEGEDGVPGVKVELIDSSGAVVETTETSEDGKYVFRSVPCGEYVVRFTAPEGVGEYTTPDAGDDDGVDSDPTPTDDNPRVAETPPFTIGEDRGDPSDNLNPTIDAGIVPPTCAIGDYVWLDANKNGVQDKGEDAAPGVTVTLLDAAGEPVDGIDPVTSDDNGQYAFDQIACAKYRVAFTDLPKGYKLTRAGIGDDMAADSNPNPDNGVTPRFRVGRGAPNTSASTPEDPYKADLVNPTIDAGLVSVPKSEQPPGDPGTDPGSDPGSDTGSDAGSDTDPSAGGTLPDTGMGPGMWVLLGLGLLLSIGGVSILYLRRRHS